MNTALLVFALVTVAALVILGFLVARLRRSEERFRLLAENASDMIAVHKTDGTYLWVSPSVERLLGYTPRELVGKNPYTLFHPDDVPHIRGTAHEPALSGTTVRVTYRIRRKDNTYLWFESLTQPIYNSKGEVVQLQTASRDVTEQKRARDLYRFLIRHLPDTSVFLFDREFRHLVADGTITGRTIPPVDNLEGKSLWEVFPEDMAIELSPFYQGLFKNGAPIRIEKSFRTRTYNIHFLPVHGALGDVELGMAVFHDVTTQKATVAALEDQTADLERSNRDLEQFANVASHELKSPLRRISSFAEIMAEEYEGLLSDEADEYLNHIIDGVESLRSVIESLLTYSRVQTDRMHMDWVDMNEIVLEAVKNKAGAIRDSGAQVTKTVLPNLVTGDDVLLRQLIENLIGNAIKFNTTGRRPLVKISAKRLLLDWEFSVTDNGPGLDPAYGLKVFTMFQRLHPEVPGTGIGLALCKKIVGIHRGRIWYEGHQGEGTTFKFTISARSPDEVTQH
jgi:PAS domain S-box-containing protein